MTEITRHTPGTFCWVDSGTTDQATAQEFYSAVFGWTYRRMDESGYAVCLKGDKAVAGVYQFTPEMVEMGAVPYWLPWIAVENLDATLAEAVAAGAQPVDEPFDVAGQGRGGAFRDPAGAMCGLWQPGGLIGSALWGEHGAPSWLELQAHDLDAAGRFYHRVFGWEVELLQGPTGPYHRVTLEGTAIAGMLQMTDAMAGVPPNWAVYFAVDDAQAAAEATAAAGGGVIVPVMRLGSWGRMTVLRSADGAYFNALYAEPMD